MGPETALSRFSSFGGLGEHDLETLLGLGRPVKQFPRGHRIRIQGASRPCLYLLHSGWTMSSLTTRQGDRQVLRVHIPGDLIGLPSIVLSEAHDTITALTPVEVSVIDPNALKKVFTQSARIAAMLFAISLEERVILMDRLLSIGQMEALERMAALFVELRDRIARSNKTKVNSFPCPLTQEVIADFLGITPVHVNRTLHTLRNDQIIAWSKGVVTILDEDKLTRLASTPGSDFAYEPTWLPDISGPVVSASDA